ncbi:LOW QUALITY PROTEIN: hypothetical protein U9M48_041837 [Paspalum notatum var. saurae]|uniref:Transposase MuDR plant domain-containing protein n=1 Tax=Paspalum notatum var. saurae TaxID=547442 RepID=A0AAQ3UU34_PASNO
MRVNTLGLVHRREDTEGDVRGDEDSDNDDDRPVQVPSQWNNYDQPLVNEGETQDLQRWTAKSLKKEFGVVKSSPQVYDVKCIRDDCPFRVHAYMRKYDTFWLVSRIEHHTCILEELEVQHRNLTDDFVAQHMYSKIVNNPGYEPKSIINSIDDDFQYKISYGKAYGRNEGVGNEMGNHPTTTSHVCCTHYVGRNPGSYFEIKHYNLLEDPTKRVLQHAFFVLAACINAFQDRRPVLCIDGTFLTGRYKGTMLTRHCGGWIWRRHNPRG